MKRGWLWVVISLFLVWGCSGSGGSSAGVAWSELREGGALHAGEITGEGHLRVEGTDERVHVATFGTGALREDVWSLRGRVRHEVEGKAYFEMWSELSDGSRYFTRGLADSGVLGAMRSNSGWRPFVLPFFSKAEAPEPACVELHVVFEGKGRVELSPVRLAGHAPGEDPTVPDGAWWGSRTGGWIGGVTGGLLGVLGAIVGTMASRGRGRRWVLGLMGTVVAVGALLLAVAAVGWTLGQGFGVVFPLVLCGGLMTILFGGLLPVVRARFTEAERRRMAAMDA